MRRARAAEPITNFREAPRLKSGGRTFLLINGVWTDKDYDPNKEIPHVRLIRNSDAYNEQLAKHPGLKSLLVDLPANREAIVVYKKIVYRIVPAD
jgi:hypothetical protein